MVLYLALHLFNECVHSRVNELQPSEDAPLGGGGPGAAGGRRGQPLRDPLPHRSASSALAFLASGLLILCAFCLLSSAVSNRSYFRVCRYCPLLVSADKAPRVPCSTGGCRDSRVLQKGFCATRMALLVLTAALCSLVNK